MIKEFLMRKMLERQLKNVSKEDQEKMIGMITKNPDFFQKIAIEVKARTDNGMDQTRATMEVMKLHQYELQKLQKNL